MIKTIVTNRVKLLAPAARVDLLLELESHDNIPAIITNIFMTEATAALDVLVLRKVRLFFRNFSNVLQEFVTQFTA